jgi:hypothetical protein
MLQFSCSTTFTPEEYDDGEIPCYIFEVVHFEELQKRFDDQAHPYMFILLHYNKTGKRRWLD